MASTFDNQDDDLSSDNLDEIIKASLPELTTFDCRINDDDADNPLVARHKSVMAFTRPDYKVRRLELFNMCFKEMDMGFLIPDPYFAGIREYYDNHSKGKQHVLGLLKYMVGECREHNVYEHTLGDVLTSVELGCFRQPAGQLFSRQSLFDHALSLKSKEHLMAWPSDEIFLDALMPKPGTTRMMVVDEVLASLAGTALLMRSGIHQEGRLDECTRAITTPLYTWFITDIEGPKPVRDFDCARFHLPYNVKQHVLALHRTKDPRIIEASGIVADIMAYAVGMIHGPKQVHYLKHLHALKERFDTDTKYC